MATVTGLTADRMLDIEAASIVNGYINGSGHLILVQHDGTEIDAGDALLAVPDATTTQTGKVELATTTETNAGVDSVRAVTPASLATVLSRITDLETTGTDIISALLETDLITSYPKGLSLMVVGSGSGWTPNGGFGLVVTYHNSTTRSSQTFYANSNDKEWRRYYYKDDFGSGPGWGAWKFQGHEESLSAMSYTQSTGVGSYPEGSSQMWITAAQATSQGWDFGGNYGTLHTARPWGTTDAQQIWVKGGGSAISTTIWVRTGNSGGWAPWQKMATEAYATAADTAINNALSARLTTLEKRKEQVGTVSCTATSATAVTVHVDFPVAFAGVPKVFCNMDGAPGATASWTVRAINMSTTGFDIFLRSTTGAAVTFTINVSWSAVYYTP